MDLDDYHSTKPFSFGGSNVVYQYYPQMGKKNIDEVLAHSEVYTKYRGTRKMKTSPVYVYYKRQLVQADLVFFRETEQIKAAGGYAYLLCVIDCFTKHVWLYKLKNKTCTGVVQCFKHFFTVCGELPQNIQTDHGLEFACRELDELFTKKEVNHYYANDEKKCVIVERVQRSLQTIFYKMMDHFNSHNWTQFIDNVLSIYNSRYHRTIKMSPNEAEKDENQSTVLKALHQHYATYKVKRPKFKVGDTVRISKLKNKFKRGYHATFSDEVFRIHKVLTNLPTPRYILTEWDGTLVENGTFWPNEIVAFKFDEKNMWKVEEVLASRGSGTGKEYLVKWRGWPTKYNSWVNQSDVARV